jgi:hypothetical protein
MPWNEFLIALEVEPLTVAVGDLARVKFLTVGWLTDADDMVEAVTLATGIEEPKGQVGLETLRPDGRGEGAIVARCSYACANMIASSNVYNFCSTPSVCRRWPSAAMKS